MNPTPSATMPSRSRERGFTLIEALIVIVILGILATTALPFYRSFMTTQSIKTAAFDMMSLITYTRSEAIKRNATVTLNGSSSSLTVTVGTTTLKQQAMFSGIQLKCVDITVSPHAYTTCPTSGISYGGNGRLTTSFLPLEIYPINTSDTTSMYYRCITVDLSGRPNVKTGQC